MKGLSNIGQCVGKIEIHKRIHSSFIQFSRTNFDRLGLQSGTTVVLAQSRFAERIWKEDEDEGTSGDQRSLKREEKQRSAS